MYSWYQNALDRKFIRCGSDGDDWIAGGHLSFRGIGHVRTGQGRYYWVPISYSIPQ